MRIFKSEMLHLMLGTILITGSALIAQQVSQSPISTAPLPAQLLTGKKVFISNVPGTAFSSRTADDDPYRSYNQFYASMKSWGYYELVSSPADADLIFEICLADRPTLGDSVHLANSTRLAYLDITVRDPKTQVTLWWFAERVQEANRPATGEKNYNQAMTNLVNDLKRTIGQYPAVPANAKK